MKIKPLNGLVVVAIAKKEEKTATGIFIPDSVQETQEITEGRVVAVADGVPDLKEGDQVVFRKFAGEELVPGSNELFMPAEDILAFVERI